MRRRKRRKVVGVGYRRIVYRYGRRYVLKVARNASGIRSNVREASLYRSAPTRLRKHLGKVTRFGYRWLVMKKYSRELPDTTRYRRRFVRLKKAFRNHGIIPYEMDGAQTHEPNWQNLRIDSKGRIIVIDYGNFKDLRGL